MNFENFYLYNWAVPKAIDKDTFPAYISADSADKIASFVPEQLFPPFLNREITIPAGIPPIPCSCPLCLAITSNVEITFSSTAFSYTCFTFEKVVTNDKTGLGKPPTTTFVFYYLRLYLPMLKNLLVLQLLITVSAFAQTGPGGVGSSSNNIFWFDANRGVSAPSSNVTSWTDQSGNGLVATPPSSSAKPTLVTSSVNGYPSIDFDGNNDELWVPHTASLNLTSWHFFIVPIVDLGKDYNAWLTKGNDGNENFEMLSYSTNNIHTPIYWTDATRTFPSTANAILNTSTFEIIEYSYASSTGRREYKNATSIYTDSENKTPQTNSFDMYIGNEKATTGRFADGDLAEVVGFNGVLNNAQRIIINNYLAAKYNRSLGANDLYTMDNSGNGNYDHDVAGIGRVDASNIQNDSQGSGIVRINNPTGLGDGEFFFWGHDNGVKNANNGTDVPSGVASRMVRVWRVSESGGDVGTMDISVDLSGLGSITVGDLRLLIDTDNDGVFSDEAAIGSATAVGGNVYKWTGINIADGRRFTFGTINRNQTPMPVELTAFTATPGNNQVVLNWTTATERNNNRFEIEKSNDGLTFQKADAVASAATGGNSSSTLQYTYTDTEPYTGTSYYRLKQVDHDGTSKYSPIVSVSAEKSAVRFVIYPNPNAGAFFVDFKGVENDHEVVMEMYDAQGRKVYEHTFAENTLTSTTVQIIPTEKLAPGEYMVNFYAEGIRFPARVVVE
jgi:hypothetical protein